MKVEQLISLAERLAAHINRSEATISNRAVGNATLFRRLRDPKKGCNIHTARAALEWFDANWPADLEWPPDVPRPSLENEAA